MSGSVVVARCPSCGASTRAGSDWCTLCYADLRPPAPASEPVVAAPPPPSSLAQPPSPAVPAVVPAAAVDALTAPLAVLLGEAPSPVSAQAEPAAGDQRWPCAPCGADNPMELEACDSCGSPFGAAAGLVPRLEPGTRQRRALVAIGVLVFFLAVFGTAMWVGTQPAPRTDVVFEDPQGVLGSSAG